MANLVAQNFNLAFGPTDRQLFLDRLHHASSSLRQNTLQQSPIRIQPSPLRVQPSPLRQSPIQPSALRQSPIQPSALRQSPIQPSPLRQSPIQPSALRQSPIQPSPLRRIDVSSEQGSPTTKSPLLSPSPSRLYNKENHLSDRLCKRHLDFPIQSQKPMKRATVARRNERERNRVKLVNMGFSTLREHVPAHGKSKKKMSKVDTLRSASDYIRYLKQLLGDENALKGQFRLDLGSPPLDVESTGYASDCSSENTAHDEDEYLDFSTWFK